MTMLYVPVSLVNGNFRYIVTMVLSWSFSMTTSYMLWYGLQSFVNASIRFHVLKKCKIVAFLINLNKQVNNKQTVLSYTQQIHYRWKSGWFLLLRYFVFSPWVFPCVCWQRQCWGWQTPLYSHKLLGSAWWQCEVGPWDRPGLLEHKCIETIKK